MGRVIAVINLKGGIGKTTTVVNVSAGLALKGAHVLLVDIDAQGNLSLALGINPRRTLYEVLVDGVNPTDCIVTARPNLDLLAADDTLLTAQPTIAQRADWTRVLEKALRPLKNAYDFIFIDCGGSLTVLNVNALLAATDIIVPTTVEHFAIRGLELLLKQIIRVKNSTNSIRVIVPTMFDPRLRQSTQLMEQLQTTYGTLVTPPIRTNVRLSEAAAQGRTIYEFDPRSRGAFDYAQLVERLSQTWNFRPIVPPTDPLTNTPSTAPFSTHTNADQLNHITQTSTPQTLESQHQTITSSQPIPPLPSSLSDSRTKASEKLISSESPIVTGAGNLSQLTCPNCGNSLQRATIAGYRVAYCEHCKYKQQELASGIRR